MSEKTLNLLVPGLFEAFQPSEISQPDCALPRQLAKALGRSDLVGIDIPGINLDYRNRLKLAFYHCKGELVALEPGLSVFYMAPVFLQIQTDHILARKPFNLPDNEVMQELLKQLNQHFFTDEIKFLQLSNGELVCITSKHAEVEFVSVDNIFGRDIKHFLPAGKHGSFWKRVFNEIQMFIYQLNESSSNNWEFNSFWIWGGTDYLQNSIAPVLMGNASWITAYNHFSQTEQFEIEHIPSINEKSIIYIDERFIDTASTGDYSSWSQLLAGFENEVFSLLLKQLHAGQIGQILLHRSTTEAYKISRSQRFRLYRRKLSVQQICIKEN